MPSGPPSNGFPRFWGPMYPDVWGTGTFWSKHYPDFFAPFGFIAGNGPSGAGTFNIALESGTSVTYSWATDIHKFGSGEEQRINNRHLPEQTYSGKALLIGGKSLANRSQIAKYAALGSPFLLGLAYEGISLTDDTTGTTLNVSATSLTLCDWAFTSQRVIVEDTEGNTIEAVIQSTTSTTIEISKAPGAIGSRGAQVMPAMPVYLDPKIGFSRYHSDETIEMWNINATAILYDFAGTEGQKALISLETPVTNSGNLDGVILRDKVAGIAGNDKTITFEGDALVNSGELEEVGDDITFRFVPDTTSLGQLFDLISGSSALIDMIGTWDPLAVIAGGDDEFGPAPFDGGYDSVGVVGNGMNVTTYWFRPVWDRFLIADNTVGDSSHSLTTLTNIGGPSFVDTFGSVSDWGREIFYRRNSVSEWQWLKKFLWTIRGRWKSFWLPTWRNDLIHQSHAVGELVVLGPDADDGDFFAWWPLLREHLQVVQVDGTTTRVKITNAVDNLDGTLTLTMVDESEVAVTLSGEDVSLLSWMEICRLESDQVVVDWEANTFSTKITVRVVQR